MMGTGNPTDWWSMMMMMDANSMHSQSSSSSQHLYIGSSSNSLACNSTQDLPRSWSQLHPGGLGGENEKFGGMMMNLQNNNNPSSSSLRPPFVEDVKQEFPQINNIGRHLAATSSASWSHHQAEMAISSSPASSNCSVSASLLSNQNVFNFPSSNNTKVEYCKNQLDSSECNNSTSSGGPSKKPRVHHSSSQPSLKLQVRKEKLGDRITTLHQIVSPFGKTDTATVLSESIGYIRFLHSQIQALSTPYMGNNNPSGSMARHGHQQQSNPWLTRDGNKDLRSKGLCLVPVSCIQHVGREGAGAAGYWAPANGGGF